MMAMPAGSNKSGLVRSVLERALSKKEEDEKKRQQIPYLHGDFVTNILIRLPIESLQSSMFVCKPWYNLINSPSFVDAHLQQSESVLIFQVEAPKETSQMYSATSMPLRQRNTLSVEERLLQPTTHTAPIPHSWQRQEKVIKFFILFVEFKEGKSKTEEYNISCQGRIIASCNGLILLENKLKRGALIVMNPVTRKVVTLPVGTLSSPHKQSYGFAFSDATGEYNVVHMFIDQLGHTNCEIISLGTRMWREVNGPAFGRITAFSQDPPVSAIGALHWVPQSDNVGYIVSMGMDDEKFYTKHLPKIYRAYDSIIEMNGCLCYITHEGLAIDIWTLRSLQSGDWTRQYTITKGAILDMVPLLSLRIRGDLIFRRVEDGSVYAYDFKEETMREVETGKKSSWVYKAHPHVNSFVPCTRS